MGAGPTVPNGADRRLALADETIERRRNGKSDAAFRTISEVASELDLPQHVLRFWESKFPQVRPMKRGGGRRYYRPEDIDLLRGIRDLLHRDGYTIKGVQKLLRETGSKAMLAERESISPEPPAPTPSMPKTDSGRRDAELKAILKELRTLRDVLAAGGN